jgi:hypothetical protein
MSDARSANRQSDLPSDLVADARAFIDHSDWRLQDHAGEPALVGRGSGRA